MIISPDYFTYIGYRKLKLKWLENNVLSQCLYWHLGWNLRLFMTMEVIKCQTISSLITLQKQNRNVWRYFLCHRLSNGKGTVDIFSMWKYFYYDNFATLLCLHWVLKIKAEMIRKLCFHQMIVMTFLSEI